MASFIVSLWRWCFIAMALLWVFPGFAKAAPGESGRLVKSELTKKKIPSRTGARPVARMSVTGYRVYGTRGYGLIKRSGPSTWSTRVGWLSEGTWVDIACQQRSSSSVGGSTIWDRLSDGTWVSDYYMSTPVYNGFMPGIPQCDAAATATREQRAIEWARSQLGSSHQADGRPWNGWCDRFVANAYGMLNSGYHTAYQHWLNLQQRGLVHHGDTNVPAGALAFYGNNWAGGAGHVMLSTGGGRFISTGSVVHETGLSSGFGRYLGWAWANPEWRGR